LRGSRSRAPGIGIRSRCPSGWHRARPGADSSWHPGRCRSRSARRVMDRSRWSCWAASTRPRPQRLSGPPFAAGAEVLIAPNDAVIEVLQTLGIVLDSLLILGDVSNGACVAGRGDRRDRGRRAGAPARVRVGIRALRRAAARLPDRHRLCALDARGAGTAQPPTEINTCRSDKNLRNRRLDSAQPSADALGHRASPCTVVSGFRWARA
jgi:hypothetical protein